MTQFIVAALMWLLTAALAVTAHRRRSQQILLASTLIAGAMTLNIDGVYLHLDAALGARNGVTLLADLLLVGGVHLLSAAIIGAVLASARPRWSLSLIGLMATIAIMVLAFPMIATEGSTTRFMADYGDQLAAAVYSSAQYLYISVVMLHAGIVVARNIRFMRSRGYQVGYWLLASGCAVALLLGVDVIGMNVTHVLGATAWLRSLQAAYDLVFIAAMLFLCGGLATVAASGLLRTIRRQRQGERLREEVERIWGRHVRTPAIPLPPDDDPEMRLHRMLVEIRDAQLAAGGTRALTDQEMDTVRKAEDYLTLHASLKSEVDG